MPEMNLDKTTDAPTAKEQKPGANAIRGGAETRPFLQSIIRRRLLTAEEEIALARRIQAGDARAKDILVEIERTPRPRRRKKLSDTLHACSKTCFRRE